MPADSQNSGLNLKIDGKLLTRNWGINLLGQLLPLVAALCVIPFVVRGLGSERFGLLSIAWAVLGSLSLFDFGLGRATTKFVAEYLGRGDSVNLPALVRTSLLSQAALGTLGSVGAICLLEFVANRFLRMSPQVLPEAKESFLISAISFPIVLVGNALRGVLEAVQRFDLVNYVKVPLNISIFLLPALALPFALHLPGIVFLLVLSRIAAIGAYLIACCVVLPELRRGPTIELKLLRPLRGVWGMGKHFEFHESSFDLRRPVYDRVPHLRVLRELLRGP